MNKLLSMTLATVLSVAAGSALAHHCPKDMAAIDAKLATSPTLTDADLAKVKLLRSEGEVAHKAGKHDDAVKSLGDARKILGI